MIIIEPPEFYGRKCNVCGDKNALCEINFRNDHNNHGNVVALCPDCAETLAYIVESYKEGKTMAKEYIEREAAMPDGFCVGVSCQECPFCDDPIKGGCKVARFIDAIPAADVVERPRWIPVTERLPEEFQPVWVACKMDGRENWTFDTVYDPYLKCPWGSYYYLEKGEAVVYAWMDRSAPEPPKEEEEA